MRLEEIPGLRSLSMFGSCLSPLTRKPDSVPDWFAVVDDVDAALRWFGIGAIGRLAARVLWPVTVPPKVNLIEPGQLFEALGARRDLYLAARLGKRMELHHARDAQCAAELEQAQGLARATLAEVAQWGRNDDAETFVRRCIAISYESEIRPERPEKIAALFDAFAGEYRATYGPLQRRSNDLPRERRRLSALLWSSRLRAAARWPKNMLTYRGWFPYLVAKLRRSLLPLRA